VQQLQRLQQNDIGLSVDPLYRGLLARKHRARLSSGFSVLIPYSSQWLASIAYN
jgi:hypothetical protein